MNLLKKGSKKVISNETTPNGENNDNNVNVETPEGIVNAVLGEDEFGDELLVEIEEEPTPLAKFFEENNVGNGTLMTFAGGAIAISAVIAWAGAVLTRKAAGATASGAAKGVSKSIFGNKKNK